MMVRAIHADLSIPASAAAAVSQGVLDLPILTPWPDGLQNLRIHLGTGIDRSRIPLAGRVTSMGPIICIGKIVLLDRPPTSTLWA